MTTATTEALRLTERINRIEPSATMAVVAEAEKLRSQGIDVVDFGAGEPHFATPQHIKDAAIAAIQGNFTKYTAVAGTAELRDAIVHRHNVDFDSDYRREEVIASTGGKHALFNAIQVLVDHGDEVDSAGAVLGFVQRHCALCRRKLRSAGIGRIAGIPRHGGNGRQPGYSAHQGHYSELAVEPFGRGDEPGRYERGHSPSAPARNLGSFGRVLCVSELQQEEFFCRITA